MTRKVIKIALYACTSAVLLRPEETVLEAALGGCVIQIESRNLTRRWIEHSYRTVLRFSRYTNEYPWAWTPPTHSPALLRVWQERQEGAGHRAPCLDWMAHATRNDELPTRELPPLLHPNVFYTGAGSSFTHNDKDKAEAYLFNAQRAGKTSLAATQRAVSRDWTTAVAVLGLPPIPAAYRA